MPYIGILESFQLKAVCMLTETPWYAPNTILTEDLQIPKVKHEISDYSYHYSKRLSVQPNELIVSLNKPPETR
jgi:hypothetical protein